MQNAILPLVKANAPSQHCRTVCDFDDGIYTIGYASSDDKCETRKFSVHKLATCSVEWFEDQLITLGSKL